MKKLIIAGLLVLSGSAMAHDTAYTCYENGDMQRSYVMYQGMAQGEWGMSVNGLSAYLDENISQPQTTVDGGALYGTDKDSKRQGLITIYSQDDKHVVVKFQTPQHKWSQYYDEVYECNMNAGEW